MYKIAKGARSVDEGRLTPYLFPSLPVGGSKNQESGPGRKVVSRRVGFEKKGRVFPEFEVASGETQEVTEGPKSSIDGIKEQTEEISEKAYVKGYEEGEKAGMEAEKKKLKPVLETLRASISELDNVRSELHSSAERQAVELALVIAKKIVGHEVSINKEVIFRVLKETLKRVTDQEEIHIKINPSDLQAIKDAEFQVSSIGKGVENVTLESADAISRGGCLIETNFGVIDARIDSQVQVVEEALRAELQEAGMGS